MKILSTILIAILLSSLGISQDAFFSNYQYSNALTNPTQMAISNDINLTLVHRSQWTNIVKPFTTSQFEGSYPILQTNTNKKIAVIGFSFVNDRVGEGGYLQTNQLAFNFAYNLSLGNSNLAIGSKLGYFNSSTDLDGLTTGSQFTGGTYTPSANNGETEINPVIQGLEISPSITWYQNDSLGRSLHYFGITAFNVNEPSSGFLSTDMGKPMRMAITGGTNVVFGKLGLSPNALFMMQGNQNQVVIGADLKYFITNTNDNYTAIAFGIYNRMKDASIVTLKYLSDIIDGGITYDINTSNLTDGLNQNTGSFEIFLNYRIKSKSKIKQFNNIVEVYDKNTKELITASASYPSKTTGSKVMIFENKSSDTTELNQREEYDITITKDGYQDQEIHVIQNTGVEVVTKVFMAPSVTLFDLEIEIFDRETNKPITAKITYIDPITMIQTELGEGDKISKELESGIKHIISANAEGYDNGILEIRYDKFGTLSKSIYLSKTKLELVATSLKIIVLDETTKKPIKSTIMLVNVTNESKHINSLIALEGFAPEAQPLEIGNKFEILVTKEGYFNQTLKVEAIKVENIERVVLLSSIEVGKSIIVDDLLFKTGKKQLDERSYRILDQLVDFLNQNPTIKIELQGHTDSDGSKYANQDLSEGRAKSAIAYMELQGISSTRLVAKGFGEDKPIATNDSAEGKAKNRRVELKIVGK
jgi:type IX secretion system PorP/SprF family membrane protein